LIRRNEFEHATRKVGAELPGVNAGFGVETVRGLRKLRGHSACFPISLANKAGSRRCLSSGIGQFDLHQVMAVRGAKAR
jgi:hypothetical protein